MLSGFLDTIPENDLVCYVSSKVPISPIKNGTEKKYFSCQMKYGEDKYIQATVFDASIHEKFHNMRKQQSPVKLRKFTLSRKYNNPNVLINRKLISNNVVPSFSEDNKPNNDECCSVKDLHTIAQGQLVTIKGKVVTVTAAKKFCCDDGTELLKQEIEVVDPTGSIKVVLWGNDVSSVEESETYFF